MKFSSPETISAKPHIPRIIFSVLGACLISILNIILPSLNGKLYDLAFNPLSLFIITFTVSSVLLCYAFILLSAKGSLIPTVLSLLSAVIVIGVSYALGGDISDLLLSIMYIPSALTVSICMKNICEKTHTVVANAVIIGALFLSLFFLTIYSAFGEISHDAISEIIKTFRQIILSFYENQSQYYSELGITLSQFSLAFNTLILILPAIFCVSVSVLSYIEVSIIRTVVVRNNTADAYDNFNHWPFKMSRLASIIYLVLLVFISISADSITEFTTACILNIVLILLPGFFLIGLRTTIFHFKKPGFFGMIFGILILISCIQNPMLLFLLVSVLGSFDNLFTGFRKYLYDPPAKK